MGTAVRSVVHAIPRHGRVPGSTSWILHLECGHSVKRATRPKDEGGPPKRISCALCTLVEPLRTVTAESRWFAHRRLR